MKKAIDFAKSRRVVDSAESSRAVSFKARVETRHKKTTKKLVVKKESEIQTLTKLVVNGFERMEKRFEVTDKRFVKNENDIETLAILVSNGFERVEKRFNELETDVEKGFKKVDERFFDLESKMNHKFDLVDTQISSLHNEQKETNRRLDIIEKKQTGVLLSVDEAIHRSEFKSLISRVSVLEKKFTKK